MVPSVEGILSHIFNKTVVGTKSAIEKFKSEFSWYRRVKSRGCPNTWFVDLVIIKKGFWGICCRLSMSVTNCYSHWISDLLFVVTSTERWVIGCPLFSVSQFYEPPPPVRSSFRILTSVHSLWSQSLVKNVVLA